MSKSDYDLNEKLEATITLTRPDGEETMRVKHDDIDILRLCNLIQIFTAGRFGYDARMTIDIAYPMKPEVVIREYSEGE